MKKPYIILAALLALAPFKSVAAPSLIATSQVANDGRQRTATTIVADVLAQLPATDRATYDKAIADLASTGKEGVHQLIGMLQPAAEGVKNSPMEYALAGLVAYVTEPNRETERTAVRTALKEAIPATADAPTRAFLMNLLVNCATPAEIPFFVSSITDPALEGWSAYGLAMTPGSEEAVMALVKAGTLSRTMLANLVADKGLAEAEGTILSWLKQASKAPAAEQQPYYRALGRIGTAKSLSALKKAAKAQKFAWGENGATEAYFDLLMRMASNPATAAKAVKEANDILKANYTPAISGGALTVITAGEGEKSIPLIIKAMASPSRDYRMHALRMAQPFANAALYSGLDQLLANAATSPVVKADILGWYCATNAASQLPSVLASVNAADDEEAAAAIAAASRIGGDKALAALIGLLDSPRAPQARAALLSFNGAVNPGSAAALSGTPATQVAALQIASDRRMKEVADKVFTLLNSTNADVANAAWAALPGVVTEKDFNAINALAQAAAPSRAAAIQAALKSAVRNLAPAQQYATVAPAMKKSATPELFYPILAQTGTAEAMADLLAAYDKGNRQAFNALLTLNNPAMVDALFNIAQKNPADAAAALNRYTALVGASRKTPEAKYLLYTKALELAKDAAVRNNIINGLANVPLYCSFTAVEPFLADKATAPAAANALRAIASKMQGRIGGPEVKKVLENVIAEFRSQAGNPDAGYAIDDINGLIAKLPADNPAGAAPEVKLWDVSPQEKAEGFRALFNGVDMDNFTGNTIDYVPVNGEIMVSAQYGGTGNLYTKEEFSDFIFRFEFCFDREGVNNGIGIRTPMGVDAAYEGMEIQILDHDAPIYKGLRDYQVHGSVYGIIPAKRIKHNPLGTWSTEEIRAIGDHITVTVNGEVILDGNIREACQGHNVSPDGPDTRNNFTVDHLNHPGLFNKKGHIGFLGHGAGLRFRNIRVKPLDADQVKTMKVTKKKK